MAKFNEQRWAAVGPRAVRRASGGRGAARTMRATAAAAVGPVAVCGAWGGGSARTMRATAAGGRPGAVCGAWGCGAAHTVRATATAAVGARGPSAEGHGKGGKVAGEG